jgi:hypothetical protein
MSITKYKATIYVAEVLSQEISKTMLENDLLASASDNPHSPKFT